MTFRSKPSIHPDAIPLLKTALVLDDSSSIRAMVSAALANAGFNVIESANGTERLAAIDRQAIDVIITDPTMAVMDGITFIGGLRARVKHRSIPVLILTADRHEATKQVARIAGATRWILKPFDQEQLLALVAGVVP